MLKDNIELHLQKNAILVFSPDKSLYVDSNPKASRALAGIRASKRKNIAITGDGIIDGNGEYWRPVKRSKVSDVEWKMYQERIGGVERDKGSDRLRERAHPGRNGTELTQVPCPSAEL